MAPFGEHVAQHVDVVGDDAVGAQVEQPVHLERVLAGPGVEPHVHVLAEVVRAADEAGRHQGHGAAPQPVQGRQLQHRGGVCSIRLRAAGVNRSSAVPTWPAAVATPGPSAAAPPAAGAR